MKINVVVQTMPEPPGGLIESIRAQEASGADWLEWARAQHVRWLVDPARGHHLDLARAEEAREHLILEAMSLGVPAADARQALAIACLTSPQAFASTLSALLWRLRESGPAAIIDMIVSVFYTQERCQFERVALDKRMLEGLDAAYADMFAKAIDAKMSELSRVR